MKQGLILFILVTALVFGQQGGQKALRTFNPPDEMVSLSANITFEKAIALINQISEKKSGKKVISLVKREAPIGVEIINVPYEKALLMIVQYAGLVFEKKETSTIIKSKIETTMDVKPETYADINTREVKISAIFFELDINTAKERGVNWQFLLSNKGGSISTGITTTGAAKSGASSDFTASGSNQFGLGGFFGQTLSLFRYFESENMGEIIASPSVTVRNRTPGKVQVGSDYSIKIRDFSGNVVENFFSTGTIIRVTPYVYEQDALEYCLLDIDVERSSAIPSDLTTEVKKTSAKTQVMMLDGEETAIGGLYVNEETKTRAGIPYLRDLPWWVLGIRYLTGSDVNSVSKKELVIVIKVELVPTLKDRLALPGGSNVLEKVLRDKREQMKVYQFDSANSDSTKTPILPPEK